MPFNGSGTFNRVHNWTSDAANSIDINATEMDAEDNGFAAGLSNCVTRDGQGQMGADFLPSIANTFNLGTAAKPWASVNGVPIANIIAGVYYKQTPAEAAASVTPISYLYPTLDIRRYGGDPTGTTDNTIAFQTLFTVMLQLGGASATLPPGKYNLNTSITEILTPTVGPNSESFGISLYAYGASINYTAAAGYAFDFSSPNSLATFYKPWLSIFGLNIIGNATAAGGIRTSDISAARFVDCTGQGFTVGAAFSLRNTVAWSENCHFLGCSAVNCQTGIAFVNTLVPPAGVSFARTTVVNFFGAGISGYWFDIGGGCAVYDSRFTHICGNFGSIAYFGIGAGGAGATMQSSVIDGVAAEWNGNSGSVAQSIIRLRDYPQASGALRPTVYNIGGNALSASGSYAITGISQAAAAIVTINTVSATNPLAVNQVLNVGGVVGMTQINGLVATVTAVGGVSGAWTATTNINSSAFTAYGSGGTLTITALPVWASSAGATLAGPESTELQPFILQTGLTVQYGISQVYENLASVAAVRTVATENSTLPVVTMTGFASLSGRMTMNRAGNVVTLAAFDPLTGASNSTAMGLTGITAEFQPSATRLVPVMLQNNGATVSGQASISPAGVITFSMQTAINVFSTTGFTNGGVNGLPSGTVITYPL